MNEQIYEIYESIADQIEFFKQMPIANSEAKIGREGIIRGLEIALEQIINKDTTQQERKHYIMTYDDQTLTENK